MDERLSKEEIIQSLRQGYEHFCKTVFSLTLEEMLEPGVVGEWSIKDVLAHLIFWNYFVAGELQAALVGRKIDFDHSDQEKQNAEAIARYRDHSLFDVRARFGTSMGEVSGIVWSLPDEAFQPDSLIERVLEDTVSGAVGNNTYDHYALHEAQIRAWIETRKER